MDFSSLKEQVSNLTLYDLKAGVRKVQNAVMNYTEMEAKVREATNNEPWGASTTLLNEIASGTFQYGLLTNEIMPMVYKRFTEKTAAEWRQIYKGLQLLEFLIKNGSERVVDDARSHLSLLKMLRQFQFIDEKGKDQGINVRNRAKELVELLGDVDRIRAERKKAKGNRNKYGGVEGGAGLGSGTSRYGGFGSESSGAASFGGYSGGVYGDGGGFGGQADSGWHDDKARRTNFEEYDERDDDAGGSSTTTPVRKSAGSSSLRQSKTKPLPPKKQEPEVDLFDFGEEVSAPTTTSSKIASAPVATTAPADDDDFDDFISAPAGNASTTTFSPPPTTTSFAAPRSTPAPAPSGPNYNIANFSSTSALPTQAPSTFSPQPTGSSGPNYNIGSTMQAQAPRPTGYQAAQPNYFTSVPAQTTSTSTPSGQASGVPTPQAGNIGIGGSKPSGAAKPDAFASLWSSTSATAGIKKTTTASSPNLASLAKEKSTAGIWGAPAAANGSNQSQATQQTRQNDSFGDLLG